MHDKQLSDGGECARDAIERRTFLTALGAGAAFLSGAWPMPAMGAVAPQVAHRNLNHARVRAAFLYPDSKTFSEDPDGWWSWPGNDYEAEQRQKDYMAAFKKMEAKLGVQVQTDPTSIGTARDTQRLIKELKDNPPDGLLLVMFYNRSLGEADKLIAAAEELGIPVIFYIGLGVKHGQITQYRKPGLYFIQSLDNLDAIEYGLRMIDTKKLLAQKRLLSITEQPKSGKEEFFGIDVRGIPFKRYAAAFEKTTIDASTRAWLKELSQNATELRGVSTEALDNAARAHLALTKMIADEEADGVTMNCLKRGMLKPCISFATLNGQLIPAACENDLPAAYSQLIGQMLTGRPGFQHNPAFDTERNHYYASHCTCSKDMHGPGGEALPYLLRRFAHTNEGSCAIQVFWKPEEPVTMMRYNPGAKPSLDVYAGRVAKSYAMPPCGGCTTNVSIELTDRSDACMVKGHHNQLFCGDYARKFRLFANLCKLPLAETGYEGSVY